MCVLAYVCAAMCTCVCAPGDEVMTFVCVCVCLCVCVLAYLVCNPFILTVAVLSGDRKEAAENKRLTLEGPFCNTEPAAHNW